MTLLLKDPEATLDYSVDWGADYLARLTADGPNGQTVVETANRSLLLGPSQIPGAPGQSIRLSVRTVGPTALSQAVSTALTL